MLGTEADAAGLTDPVDARQQHLRRACAIPLGRRLEAVVTVAAGRGGLTEIVEQPHPSTAHALAQSDHGVELRRADAAKALSALGLFDHAPQLNDVREPENEPRIGRQAIPAGAPGLLIVT